VTGTVSEEFAVNSLKEGADDYILKGNLTRLPSAILNTLKQKLEEVNRKKAEDSLKEQNIELIKINQELDRFVYSASHDLKAPLKSVLGLLKLAEGDLQNESYHSMSTYHRMIEGSVAKLDATIKEIENYSRNIRTNIIYEKIDLRIMTEEILQSLQYTEGAEALKTYLNFENGSLLVSDPSRIRIILSNIISNAIKYRDKEKKESFLSISTEISNTVVCIRIEDNGIGIEADYIEKIYNMFYRATEKSEGSGLGLYIVKETIDRLKGSIIVESVIKEKTLFTIRIPNNINEK
jgi:signal transduction histidine kinase